MFGIWLFTKDFSKLDLNLEKVWTSRNSLVKELQSSVPHMRILYVCCTVCVERNAKYYISGPLPSRQLFY